MNLLSALRTTWPFRLILPEEESQGQIPSTLRQRISHFVLLRNFARDCRLSGTSRMSEAAPLACSHLPSPSLAVGVLTCGWDPGGGQRQRQAGVGPSYTGWRMIVRGVLIAVSRVTSGSYRRYWHVFCAMLEPEASFGGVPRFAGECCRMRHFERSSQPARVRALGRKGRVTKGQGGPDSLGLPRGPPPGQGKGVKCLLKTETHASANFPLSDSLMGRSLHLISRSSSDPTGGRF